VYIQGTQTHVHEQVDEFIEPRMHANNNFQPIALM
jgi:hypothetical protein